MTAETETRSNRLYTRDHEWAKLEGSEVLVGITAFAVEQLGDITLVDITTVPGDTVVPHQVFGTVESVKSLSDLFAPLGGRVTRVNHELVNHPEWVNEDCWERAWMIAVEPEPNSFPSSDLLDVGTYRQLLDKSDR
jgi:glycine cleavage system H protein